MSQDWADIHHRAVSWDRSGIRGAVPADVRALSLTSPDWAAEHRNLVAGPPSAAATPNFALTGSARLFLHRMRDRGRSVICRSKPIYVKCICSDGRPEYICMKCEARVVLIDTESYAYWMVYIDQDYVPGQYRQHPFLGAEPLREEPPHNTRTRFRALAGILPMCSFVQDAFDDLQRNDAAFQLHGVPGEDNPTVHRNHRIVELLRASMLPDARSLR